MSNKMQPVWDVIESEGFDYGIRNYSSAFEDIEDEEFHELLNLYIAAADALEAYIGEPETEEEEEE